MMLDNHSSECSLKIGRANMCKHTYAQTHCLGGSGPSKDYCELTCAYIRRPTITVTMQCMVLLPLNSEKDIHKYYSFQEPSVSLCQCSFDCRRTCYRPSMGLHIPSIWGIPRSPGVLNLVPYGVLDCFERCKLRIVRWWQMRQGCGSEFLSNFERHSSETVSSWPISTGGSKDMSQSHLQEQT